MWHSLKTSRPWPWLRHAHRCSTALAAGITLGLTAAPVLLVDPLLHPLQTGRGISLQNLSIALAPPAGILARSVEFTVGFASAESPGPATFLDSLSVFLQGSLPANTAFLLTADAPGFVWQPPLPGGLTPDPISLRSIEVPWPLPPESSPGDYHAYRVTFELPPALQSGPLELRLSLFDNLILRESLGFIDDVVVRTDPFLLVESAASVLGPYAIEPSARHDLVRHEFVLPRPETARFFRLQADSAVTLRILAPTSRNWRFTYEFPAAVPVLESSATPGGPYTVETRAVLDESRRLFRLPTVAANRFFRLRGAVRTRLEMPQIRGDQIELGYRFNPSVFSLQSSAQYCGPFANEDSARFNLTTQAIELSRDETLRFFRLAQPPGSPRAILQELRNTPESWVLRYDPAPVKPVMTAVP